MQNIAFCSQEFFDITQQCFALLPKAKFPTNTLKSFLLYILQKMSRIAQTFENSFTLLFQCFLYLVQIFAWVQGLHHHPHFDPRQAPECQLMEMNQIGLSNDLVMRVD